MKKSFFLLSFLMGVIVLSSNYLVQFPVNYYGLNQILTYGAFSYPVAFLITDLANRSYGKIVARKIVYFGFFLGIGFTVLFSTNFADLISIRIAIGSGVAFLIAQLLDVQIFDNLRKKKMVCCSTYFFTFWINSRYFFIFFNFFLRNWDTMVYLGVRRFNSKNNCSINYAYSI